MKQIENDFQIEKKNDDQTYKFRRKGTIQKPAPINKVKVRQRTTVCE